MTRAQWAVRWLIRLLMPVFVLGAVGAIAGTLWFSFGQQREVGHSYSPDGVYRASLVTEPGSCGDSFSGSRTTVFVERRWFFINARSFSPFCAGGRGQHIQLRWRDTRTLLIECQDCQESGYELSDTNWGELRFAFDPDQH